MTAPEVIVVDTETTGLLLPSSAPLDKQPRIIELCVARVVDGEIVSEHEWLINPGIELPPEITKITGITADMLVDKPSFSAVLEEISAAFNNADFFIAHNAPFDSGMIKNELRRAGALDSFPFPKTSICTVQEYLHEFGRRPKLTELYEKKIGKPLAQTHRALDDVKALIEILRADMFFSTLGAA